MYGILRAPLEASTKSTQRTLVREKTKAFIPFAKMFLLLALVVLLSGPVGVWSTGTMEETFVKMRVPTGYFPPLEEVSVTRATSAMCVFLCVANPGCKGFVFAGTQCTLGTLDLSVGPYVATFIPEGLDIMVQSDKVNFGALKVPHIGHLYVDTEGQDAAMNATIPAAPIPRVPDSATHDKRFGVLNYKEDIISCGGVVGATYEKKCWRWSFRSGAWSVMHGELNHLHFHGGLVQVAGKLWMIMGSSVHNTPVAVKKVETYDLRAPWRGWKEEPDADVEFAVTQFNAVVFDDAKVRRILSIPTIIGGQRGGDSPQAPISYLVTYKLFVLCPPPPSTKTRGHLCLQSNWFYLYICG